VSEFLEDEGASVFYVDDSDHHMYFDNPESMMEQFNEDLLNSQIVINQEIIEKQLHDEEEA
jgi:hypothetical protein